MRPRPTARHLPRPPAFARDSESSPVPPPLTRSPPPRAQTAMVSWEDSRTREERMNVNGLGPEAFVDFFRQASPYIIAHQGSVVVIVIPGTVMTQPKILEGIVQDVALLQSLGVRVVLVLGSTEQVNAIVENRGIESVIVDGYRVTCPEALEVAMEAAGRNNVVVQALLSRGINVAVTRKHGDKAPNQHETFTNASQGHGNPAFPAFPQANVSNVSTRPGGAPVAVSGNFIVAKRRGVVDGVDFLYTGDVVSVDVNAVRQRLAQGDVVLLSSLGFNAAGEVLNCQCYDVAVSVAIDLGADKLVSYVAPRDMPKNDDGERMKYMPLSVAERFISELAEKKGARDEGDIEGADIERAEFDGALRADDASAWSEEVTRAVRHSSSTSSTDGPPRSDADGWMLDGWRWLKQPELLGDGALKASARTDASASADWSSESLAAANSPWRRLTERGLRWRVEGCPQEVCAAVFSCKAGVRRAHLVDYSVPGALLLELYTFDGIGAMVSRDRYEGTRPAKPGDWIHIKTILEPLAAEGTTVAVSDDALIDEVSAGNFSVMERDGKVIACAALRLYPARTDGSGATTDEGVAEVASFAVRPGYRNEGRGDQMLSYLETRAKEAGIEKLFLLTTRTADWFTQRGFIHAGAAVDSPLLPPGKKAQEGRNSQLYIRALIE